MEPNLEDFNKLEKYRINIFSSHAKFLLLEVIEPWVKNILPAIPPPSKDLKYIPLGLIVEDRATFLLRFCVLNTILMGRLRMPIRVCTTSSSFDSINQLLGDLKEWVEIVKLDQVDITHITDISYNSLLKKASFWRKLPSEKILVIQTDALLIEPLEFQIFSYDYVGAPWSRKKFTHEFPVYSNDLVEEKSVYSVISNLNSEIDGSLVLGNGGLSIRNKRLMIDICESESSIESEGEDVYISRSLLSRKAMLPPVNVARRFSCETKYYTSIGSHKSHLYLSGEQQAEIYERHFKHLTALIRASSIT